MRVLLCLLIVILVSCSGRNKSRTTKITEPGVNTESLYNCYNAGTPGVSVKLKLSDINVNAKSADGGPADGSIWCVDFKENFIFRDVNANGTFEEGEQIYAQSLDVATPHNALPYPAGFPKGINTSSLSLEPNDCGNGIKCVAAAKINKLPSNFMTYNQARRACEARGDGSILIPEVVWVMAAKKYGGQILNLDESNNILPNVNMPSLPWEFTDGRVRYIMSLPSGSRNDLHDTVSLPSDPSNQQQISYSPCGPSYRGEPSGSAFTNVTSSYGKGCGYNFPAVNARGLSASESNDGNPYSENILNGPVVRGGSPDFITPNVFPRTLDGYTRQATAADVPNGLFGFRCARLISSSNIISGANPPSNPTPDTQNPTVSITSPANGASVSGTSVSINVNANDNVGVARVEFYIDNNLKSSVTSSPYNYVFNSTSVANGTHTILVKAFDAANNQGSFSGNVIVNNTTSNPNPDTTPPTLSVTNPANNATVSASLNITANASDNIGVTKVEFYVDGVLKSTDTTNPYSYSLDTTSLSNASHAILLKAYDAASNLSTASINVVVSNTIANPNPPQLGSTIGTFNITNFPPVGTNAPSIRAVYKINEGSADPAITYYNNLIHYTPPATDPNIPTMVSLTGNSYGFDAAFIRQNNSTHTCDGLCWDKNLNKNILETGECGVPTSTCTSSNYVSSTFASVSFYYGHDWTIGNILIARAPQVGVTYNLADKDTDNKTYKKNPIDITLGYSVNCTTYKYFSIPTDVTYSTDQTLLYNFRREGTYTLNTYSTTDGQFIKITLNNVRLVSSSMNSTGQYVYDGEFYANGTIEAEVVQPGARCSYPARDPAADYTTNFFRYLDKVAELKNSSSSQYDGVPRYFSGK